MAGRVWPDGGALLDQPLVLIDAFRVIDDQIARMRQASGAPSSLEQ